VQEAKRAENAGAQEDRPVSTISSGGTTINLPGSTPVGDPNDPLTALEAIGAYNPETGVADPKLTGAAAKPEIEQFKDLIEDMFGKNPDYMTAMLSGEGWEDVRDSMRAMGEEAGFSEETINSGIAMWEALVPEPKPPPEPGTISKAWSGVKEAVTPGSPLNKAIEERLGVTETMSKYPGIPFGEARAAEEGVAGPAFEGLAKGISPEFGANLADFMTRIITGPFYNKSQVSRETGKPITKEPEVKEVGEITEQDLITEMGTWDEDTVKAFQDVAKKAGLYKGEVNGKISHALESAMKEYYKTHKEEWK